MPVRATPLLHAGDERTVVFENLAFGGEVVGRIDGFAVFVFGALPGETARVRIKEVHPRFARAELLSVESVSPDRRSPLCPIFHACGGCHLQHLDYPKQLTAKRQMVVDCLTRIGRLPEHLVQPCLPAPNPYHYRNKAMPVVAMRDGKFVAGIHESASRKLVPYETCPIQSDAINDLIRKVLTKVETYGLTPYHEKIHKGFLRHLVVRHSEMTKELLLGFVTNGEAPEELRKEACAECTPGEVLPHIARELQKETPHLVGVVQNINVSRTSFVFGPQTKVLAGRGAYHERFDGLDLEVSLQSFLQVNTAQANLLHNLVREALGAPEEGGKFHRVLDLYSGIGTLSLAVAGSAGHVLGVEEEPAAVQDASRNAAKNHKKNVEFVQGDVHRVLSALKAEGIKAVDAVIVDPPRRGVAPEVLAQIASLAPKRLVYVSCDPATLARDLSLLNHHGFQVDWVQPLDMFPQTYHVETVVRLTRAVPTAVDWVTSEKEIRRLERKQSFALNAEAWPAAGGEAGVEVSRWPLVFKRPPLWRWGAALIAAAGLTGAAMIAKATWTSSQQVPQVSEPVPEVIASLPGRAFKRYELVPFEVRVSGEKTERFLQMSAIAEVFRENQPVAAVDGRYKWYLQRDMKKHRFFGFWPMPYNPPPGTYKTRVTLFASYWKQPKVYESAFTVPPLSPYRLPRGYAVLTMEGGPRTQDGAIPAPDKKEDPSPENIVHWAKLMGVDALCVLAGQTSIWGKKQDALYPFSDRYLKIVHRYAQAAKSAGLLFAAYITTFKVVGDAWRDADYDFCLRYDPVNDRLVETPHIRLDDARRRKHLVDFLKKLQKDPAVDFIGFDYIRTGFGGYEMAEEFFETFPDMLPPAERRASDMQKALWLARRVENEKDESLKELFNWYRAHRTAKALSEIIERAGLTKPVFTFTLGWEMGHQHGQDPAMFMDAGVDFNHIMLYERTAEQAKLMVHQWPAYLSRANGMYVMGEMVDFRWVQQSVNPPGPEELYRRLMFTYDDWHRVNAELGVFWHDLYRLLYGLKGPYTTWEWLIAGGKAVTETRKRQGVLPFEAHIRAPRYAALKRRTPFTVEIRNLTGEDRQGLLLHQFDPYADYWRILRTIGPLSLPAGSRLEVEGFSLSLGDDQPARENRFMAAVLLEDPAEPKAKAYDFVYVKGLPASTLEEITAAQGEKAEQNGLQLFEESASEAVSSEPSE